MSGIIKVPCQGCGEREIGCHAWCQRYKEYREQREQIRRDNLEEMQASVYTYTREKGIKAKMMRKKGGRCHER